MPNVRDAMVGSLNRGQVFARASITDEAQSVKTAFSSWDNCMAATFCKWPVVALIIVGGLIVISVVWCIARCACCGLSCCCSCFSCLACCGECCGCCTDPKGKKHKHLDDAYYDPNAGYKPQAPMMTGGIAPYAAPQYAQFETGPSGLAISPANPVSEDALPPMPSWDTATKKRVMTEEEREAVELGELDPSTGQKVPLMTGAGPISRTASPGHSPIPSPYGDHAEQVHDGYSAGGPIGAAGAGLASGAYNHNDPYSQGGANDFGQGPSPMRGPNGRGGPSEFNGGTGNMGAYGRDAPSELGAGPNPMGGRGQGYNRGGPNDRGNYRAGTSPSNAYGNGNDNDLGYGNNNPGAGGYSSPGGYGRPPPQQRQFSNDSGRPYPPSGPNRGYSNNSGPQRPYANTPNSDYTSPVRSRPSPPLNNNSGFDFNGQGQQAPFRRPSPPQQQYSQSTMSPSNYSGNTSPPTYVSRQQSIPRVGGGGGGGGAPAAYPGARNYQPAQGSSQQGW